VKLKTFFLSVFALLLILAGCSNSDKASSSETVTANVLFRSFEENPQGKPGISAASRPLPGVCILLIGSDGKVIDKLITNEQGEAQKNITVPIDNKYLEKATNTLKTRGTVTAIAFKDGYRQTVLFETPVSEASAAQPFYMKAIVPGGRNEPEVQLGNNHHLEIISLVERYSPNIKNGK